MLPSLAAGHRCPAAEEDYAASSGGEGWRPAESAEARKVLSSLGEGGRGGGGGLGGLGLGEGGSALLTSPLLLGDLSTQQSPYPVPRGPLARNAWSRDVIC